MDRPQRSKIWPWLSAARHPARNDGVIAVAILVLPWPLAWALAPRDRLDGTEVAILVAATIPLATLWLGWAALRNASRLAPEDGGAGPGTGLAPVIAVGGTAIGTYRAADRPDAPRLPLSLPPRPPALAGREDLLARLHDLLSEGAAPRVVVLTGVGGVGKTSMAAEYAHQHLAEVSVAWRVPAGDETVMRQDLAELAAQLGGRDVVDSRDPVASVHAVLAVRTSQWLLIFDNAPDEESVLRFLPPAGRGWVIITSQSQHWQVATALGVPVLDADVAAGFLMSRSGDPDESAASELARELDGLPLALEQAAAYAKAAGMTLGGYLAQFRRRRAVLLARGEPAGHVNVSATFSLALSRLRADSPPAARLLRLLAFLAPEPVPLDLLLSTADRAGGLRRKVRKALRPLLGDEIAVTDAVAALRRYSLITLAGAGMVMVHRLVQEVARSQLPVPAARAWKHAAALLVAAAVPADVDEPEAWPRCSALLPHARALLSPTSRGLWRIAAGLDNGGSYAVARDLFQQIAGAHEDDPHYGPEHPSTLEARAFVAGLTGSAGDPAGARDLYADLALICERVRGREHEQTLRVRHNLAHWTGEASDAATARDLTAEMLSVYEQNLGPDHPDMLATRTNLARWTGHAGDPTAARDMLAEQLPIYEQEFGPEHPHTLDVRVNLAGWTGLAGNEAAARDMYAQLLPIRARVLGPEHPKTLTIRAFHADWTGRAGDPAKARDLLADLLPLLERVLGSEHPQTLTARSDLARWTADARQSG